MTQAMPATPLMVAPVHLRGSRQIANAFRVDKETVKAWVKGGAPIRTIGRMYQADYHLLWAWLLGQNAGEK